MARPYRLNSEDCLYHITSRGNDKKIIFFTEKDFNQFLQYVVTAKEKYKFNLYAYCLMDNHYHLLLETKLPNISQIMQYINTSYASYHNTKQKKSGHLFQGRYKSIIVESDKYFKELSRYIHLNPVRAKMAKSPDEYRWSSYNAYIRNGSDKYIDKDKVKLLLDMNCEQYERFVKEGIESVEDPLKNVYAGFMLGSVQFIKEKLKNLGSQIESSELSHRRAIRNVIAPEDIINEVAKYYNQTSEELCNSKKRPMTAKKMALYLLKTKTGLTNIQIGQYFNMNYAAVSKGAIDFRNKLGDDKKLAKIVKRITSKVEV